MWLLESCIKRCAPYLFFLHHVSASPAFALICTMSSHIDFANEVPTQELPLIEEPDDQDTEEQPPEGPPQTTNSASAEANPDEEGRQDHTTTQQILNDLNYACALGVA